MLYYNPLAPLRHYVIAYALVKFMVRDVRADGLCAADATAVLPGSALPNAIVFFGLPTGPLSDDSRSPDLIHVEKFDL